MTAAIGLIFTLLSKNQGELVTVNGNVKKQNNLVHKSQFTSHPQYMQNQDF